MPNTAATASPRRSLGKEYNISLPRLHPAQQKIAAEAKRFSVLCCGRRTGKSLFMRDRLIQVMLKGLPTGWFSPTNKILADSWREMKTVLEPVTIDKNEQEHRIEIRGKGVVEMWSLESPDAGRSRKYASIVIDEAAMAPNLLRAWQENIRPTLTDYAGSAWIGSTPRGQNYFKVLFDRGPDPEWEDWASWQMPTTVNPYLPASEIEDARRDLTEAAYNQEYLAIFVNWEGAVFRNIQECATGVEKDGPEPGHEYVIGVDWGRSRDYTVLIVIDTTVKAVVAIDRSNKVDYNLQRNRLRALKEKWHPKEIIAENNSIGQPNIEQLEREGIRVTPFETQTKSKKEIIEHLALAFERMDIVLPNHPILISELVAFQGSLLPSGMIRYSAPENQHDDTVMSLAVGWSLVANPHSYGVLSYMTKESEEMKKVAISRMLKPAISGKTTACPECGSVAVVRIQDQQKCNQCGIQWGGEQVLGGGRTRADYLAKGR